MTMDVFKMTGVTNNMRKLLGLTVCCVSFAVLAAEDAQERVDVGNGLPSFQEVREVIRTNLVGATEESVNAASVEGLLKALEAQVELVEPDDSTTNTVPSPFVTKARIYRDHIGYAHLERIAEGAAKQVREALREMASTNELIGFVLDLRFATGEDYAAAVTIADLFLDQEVALMNWGDGLKRSTAKENAIRLPMAILLNRKTTGSAEALAGALRYANRAVLIGGRTAGAAGVRHTFELSTGHRLRIVTSMVQLADGKHLSTDGLVPDVEVAVSPADEKRYLEDAFAHLSADAAGKDNAMAVQRINEADLVRTWRGEALVDRTNRQPANGEAGELVQDPSLVRALDLMQGLAVMRRVEK